MRSPPYCWYGFLLMSVRAALLEGNYNLARPVPSPAATATANPPALTPENMTTAQRFEALKKGATFDNLVNYAKENPMSVYSLAASALTPDAKAREKKPVDSDPGQQFDYQANATTPTPMSDPYGTEQKYYNQRYVPRAAGGGMMASGGLSDARYNLGGYSDGGRLLRGPGDGVSDSIPAVIGKKQPARLADGEFVIPARIVSELGNGSTEAGAELTGAGAVVTFPKESTTVVFGFMGGVTNSGGAGKLFAFTIGAGGVATAAASGTAVAAASGATDDAPACIKEPLKPAPP